MHDKQRNIFLEGQPTATDLLDEGVFYKYLAGSWLPWVSHAREDVIRRYQKIHNRPDISRQSKNECYHFMNQIHSKIIYICIHSTDYHLR